MKTIFLLLLAFCFVFPDQALAKKRRKKPLGPPTAQDAYDFSFPRFESKCSFNGRDFQVQIRGKAAAISDDEALLGSAYFFIMDGNRIAVSPGVESELQLKASATTEGSLCEGLTATEYSQGKVVFALKSAKSKESSDWVGVVWDTKSNKIIEHQKNLKAIKQFSFDENNIPHLSK